MISAWALVYVAIGAFFHWLFDAVVYGIFFRLRLWLNHICFYHGPKVGYWCPACDQDRRAKRGAKRAKLDAQRKRMIGL